jgi:hypothetical protein
VQYAPQALAIAPQALALNARQGIAIWIAFERTADRTKVADASIGTLIRTPACAAAGIVNATAINRKGNVRVITRIFIR